LDLFLGRGGHVDLRLGDWKIERLGSCTW
jgi:hypothetical protein